MPRSAVATIAVLLVVGCLPGAELEQGPGIVGTYVVNGVDPNGTAYTGRVSISRGSAADRLVIEWVVTGAILHGEGTLTGDRLAVVWTTAENPRGVSSGTAEYRIMTDGRLVGTRTMDGVDEPGTEEIFPRP